MDVNTNNDSRIILTLDAGGTNLVFSAIQANREIVDPIHKRTDSSNLERTLDTIIEGFEELSANLPGKATAISFAFPGPADYPLGIIGDLPNFEAFTGGVPLGPMLEDHFGIPVYINNDGDLFAYGEALAGFLPRLNQRIREAGGLKRYKNLIGLTLGTGFGAGVVIDGRLLIGNNSCGAEVHNTPNPWNSDWNAEESVSTRAIQRVYAEQAGSEFDPGLMPRDICEITRGKQKGNQQAANEAFHQFGRSLGNAVVNLMTLIDGVVVLGGGIVASWDLFAPTLFEEINRNQQDFRGKSHPRLSYKVYDLEKSETFREFVKGKTEEVTVRGSNRKISYDALARNGVGKTALGASQAIALGAYAYALQQLDG